MEESTMRIALFHVARRVLYGGLAMAALGVAACAESPTDQLSKAESLLEQLKSKGAEAYLKYELANARQKLEEARQFIRKNRFEAAGQYLSTVCKTLDSCSVAYFQLRQAAQRQCQQQMAGLFSDIETLRSQMTGLPRQSYIDQNRYDIYTHRLRRYREEMDNLQKLVEQEDFPTALQRSVRLEFQVKQALAGLTGVTPIPERVTQTDADQQAGLPTPLVVTTSRSGGR
jgi:hypothetical protein